MRYKTFRNLVIAMVTLLVGGASWTFYRAGVTANEGAERGNGALPPASPPAAVAGVPESAPPESPAGEAGTGKAPTGRAGAGDSSGGKVAADSDLRPIDRSILVLIQQSATSAKVKDALKRHGPKVNLYHDNGSGFYNRLKIDLDRDEKWDEKWTLDSGQVLKRQVAPLDDEHYAQEYRLEGERWVPM